MDNSKDLKPTLGLAEEVSQLMKMPQTLCKQRGICCKVATFKGSLGYEEIEVLANQSDSPAQEQAKDFISIFLPYKDQDQVREIASEFVDRVRALATSKGQDADRISFFKCRYVLESGRCGIHEDRPMGCRMYPFPHKDTIYHPGCGFEAQGVENWNRIETIIEFLETSLSNRQS